MRTANGVWRQTRCGSDSKVAATQTLLEDAPQLLDFVDAEGLAHFQQLQDLLSQLNIPFEINPNLVRGLDYYTIRFLNG